MKQYTRQELLARLHAKLDSGHILVAGGAGTGISAKFEEEGGADCCWSSTPGATACMAWARSPA